MRASLRDFLFLNKIQNTNTGQAITQRTIIGTPIIIHHLMWTYEYQSILRSSLTLYTPSSTLIHWNNCSPTFVKVGCKR